MLRKIVIIVSMAFFIGCDNPWVIVDPLDPLTTCENIQDINASIYVSSNAYDAIPVESYEINYQDGVLSKELITYEDSVIPSGFGVSESNDTICVGSFYTDPCKVEDFMSYMTIFYLDANRTYTIVGFSEEMDKEHNITKGNGADSYNVGSSPIRSTYNHPAESVRTDITKINITQTGEFTFSAGR